MGERFTRRDESPAGDLKMKRFISLLLLTLFFSFSSVVFANPPAQKIEALLQEKFPEASVGILVQDAGSGKIVYERRSNNAFAPASILKIFTVAAALKILKPDFQYETNIKKDKPSSSNVSKQNLYIQFSGDPSFTAEQLKTLLQKAMENKNKEKFNGDVVIDGTLFQEPDYPMGWSWNSLPWYFAAPVKAVILNENKIGIKIASNKVLNQKAQVSIDANETINLPLESDLISVKEETAQKECSISVETKENNKTIIKGCWPQHNDADSLKLAIKHPEALVHQLVVKWFDEMKIDWTGKVKLGKTPSQAELLAQHKSLPLKELIKPLLLESNNLYSESLLKTLGAKQLHRGTFQAGTQVIENFLKQHHAIDDKMLNIEDGSGGSRYNLITAKQMIQVLRGLYQDINLRELLLSALPISGETGTLKKRMLQPELKGRVYAKTGHISGVSTLAGYLKPEHKPDLIFVIMINNTLADKEQTHQLEEQLLLEFIKMIHA